MQAVWYERNGQAGEVLQLGELEAPTPAPGEVLVRLATSGVNPIDVKRRARRARPGDQGPAGGAGLRWRGRDRAVGEGVAPGRIGERVWVYEGQWQRPRGTAAELVTVPAERAVPLPDGHELRRGRLPRHPGADRASRGVRRRAGRGPDRAGDRRRRRGRRLCDPVRQARRRARADHRQQRREGGDRGRCRRRLRLQLQGRERGAAHRRPARRRRGRPHRRGRGRRQPGAEPGDPQAQRRDRGLRLGCGAGAQGAVLRASPTRA